MLVRVRDDGRCRKDWSQWQSQNLQESICQCNESSACIEDLLRSPAFVTCREATSCPPQPSQDTGRLLSAKPEWPLRIELQKLPFGGSSAGKASLLPDDLISPPIYRATSEDFHNTLLVMYQQPKTARHLKKASKVKTEIKANRRKKAEKKKDDERDKRKRKLMTINNHRKRTYSIMYLVLSV